MNITVILYRLDHICKINGYENRCHIGTFSSKTNIEIVIDELISKPGFCLYPRSCFIIKEVIVDEYSWKKGFTKEQNEDIEIT